MTPPDSTPPTRAAQMEGLPRTDWTPALHPTSHFTCSHCCKSSWHLQPGSDVPKHALGMLFTLCPVSFLLDRSANSSLLSYPSLCHFCQEAKSGLPKGELIPPQTSLHSAEIKDAESAARLPVVNSRLPHASWHDFGPSVIPSVKWARWRFLTAPAGIKCTHL